ncbi:LOW QUALITY PROTEIN: uncharacterized protein LOC126553366 [Aphis gossypii]|uniref:LOW QUALITY PROTEIN: uncharacterized protein LOC126553366 n=1 Tax=Aphis gossypii TaxID=80765 RepID=UPI00215912F3|nr:LOW QUALITY PROTEIN: uncharacterized protein LOC126553366 [Aphis gossypii]
MECKIQRNVISKRTCMNVIGSGLIQLNRFKKCSKTFVLKNDYNFIDFNQFFDYGFEMIVCKLKKMTQQTSIKFNLYLDCVYVHVLTQEYRDISFKTVNVLAYTNSNFENLLKKMFDKINKEESNFVTKGSGWSLYSIDALQLRINIVNPLTGSSYVILPECIRNKKAVINVKNNDNKCFKYAILTKYNTRSDKTKFSNQYFKILEKKSRLNFHCIDFPTPVNQIKSFERLNNVSVNVFSLDNKNVVFPLYMNNVESKNHFDLLLINNGITSHYCFINDFCRLIRNQKTKHKSKLIICKRCFTVFSNIPCKFKLWGIDGLKKHKKNCGKHKLGRPVMFDNGDDDTIYFKNFKRSQRIPIVIYSDFECYLKPIINNQDIKTKTLITHKHKPMSYAFYVKIDYESLSSLADNLSEDKTRFRETLKIFSLSTLNLVTRKGVFPYEYIDHPNKLNETCLPPKQFFYNSLKDEDISDEDYAHAHKYDIQIFLENGRHVKANIPNIQNINYDSNKPVTWLAYLDCVNLYGKSMLSALPHKNFEWFNDLTIDITQIEDDAEYAGYILEVDVIYPKQLHDNHNDFPFLPENKCPPNSKFTIEI